MGRGKLGGAFLCLAALVVTVVFIGGIASQAYWAIAIPVAAMVVVTMALLFWIGWTFMTTEIGPMEPPSGNGSDGGQR